jgi:tetratricopeptide (TPR) repeat protein
MSPETLLLDQAKICEQTGALEMAVEIYRAVLADRPGDVGLLVRLGLVLSQSARHSAAAEAFQRAVAFRPELGEAHILLGHAFQDLGQGREAIQAYRRAAEITPDIAEPVFQSGIALQTLNATAAAAEAYRRALAIDPQSAKSYANLGICALSAGHFAEAIAFYRRTLRLTPEAALTWSNLGNALERSGRFEEALLALGAALSLDPSHPEILYNLGNVLNRLDRHGAAIDAYRRATLMKPDFARAYDNLGVSLNKLGHLDDSIAAHRRAIALAPDNAEAHFNLSHCLLLVGDYEQGFDEFEWRWRLADFPSPKRNFSQPPWNGDPFPNKTLLVHAEQGMGDSIQFCRYIPEIAANGGRVILECPAALIPLMQGLAGIHEIIETDRTLPPFDLHVPILSLPKIFRTTRNTIPAHVPYLQSDRQRGKHWQSLSDIPPGLKVGIVWTGNPRHGNDRLRSIPWPVLQSANWPRDVALFNLQKDHIRKDATLGDGVPLRDLASDIHDFGDFAAAINAMDLLISVDTAAAHLAGALGQTVWTLLPFAPDWRWGQREETTAWYPTMRLFRQDAAADWITVLQRVTNALATMADRQNLPPVPTSFETPAG